MKSVNFLSVAAPALVLAFGTGCGGCQEGADTLLQRMVSQPKYLAYQANEFFADERAMRTPPAGTVAQETYETDRLELRGAGPSQDGGYADKNPLPITYELMATGRRHFEVYCATCHGLLGDGNSIVAQNMALRAPPSLHARKNNPDGFFYEAITYGYGVMPSFAEHLNAKDRWAVVAYLRALQLSQHASLDRAPTDVQIEMTKESTP